MYEYQLHMNPLKERKILDDKTQFYKLYSKYFVHKVGSVSDLKSSPLLVSQLLNNSSGNWSLKLLMGNVVHKL